MASEDETVTAYLQKHKIKAILDDMEAKLVKELPPDPIAFIIAKLQAIEKANKKSPAASTTTASPKRIASTTPKAVSKSPGTAKPPAAGGHPPLSAPAVPKAASSPSTTTATTPKGTSIPSRPATVGSKVPTRPKATPSPSGATRPATATSTALPGPKGGKSPASGGVAGGKASAAKVTRPVATAKPKVGEAKVSGANVEVVAKAVAKPVAQRTMEEEEEKGVVEEEKVEESYAGGGTGEDELEMGMSGSIAGREGDSSSESDEGDQILDQDEVQVDQLLDAHRRARLPRKSCSKAQAILQLRAESPSLGYVSDSSDENEVEGSGGVISTEDIKLSEEGTMNSTQSLTTPKVAGSLDGIRNLLCDRCAALLGASSNRATPTGGESVSPVAEEHNVTGTEVSVKQEAILSAQHDRYGWGR